MRCARHNQMLTTGSIGATLGRLRQGIRLPIPPVRRSVRGMSSAPSYVAYVLRQPLTGLCSPLWDCRIAGYGRESLVKGLYLLDTAPSATGQVTEVAGL